VWEKANPDTGASFFFVRHAGNGTAATDDSTTFAIGGHTVPVRVNGRDFKVLAAGYDLGRARLVYSTSEIYAYEHGVALLHGRAGESDETVLRYARRPHVRVLAGDVDAGWDAARGELRLSYVHDGLARVAISGGGRPPLLLLLADSDTASTLIFVNGWNVGQYVNDVGPQHVFVLPQGILRHQGTNTIALAVWSDDATTGGLGEVSLEALANTATGLRIGDVAEPWIVWRHVSQHPPPPQLRTCGHARRGA
jgi:hypothetical protein